MSIVLYEISDALVSWYNGKYFTNYSPLISHNDKVIISDWKLVMHSERIWRKDGDDLRYLKHRTEDIKTAVVDPVEFTFLLLKSNPL
jgi:hypothetical protein